MYLFSTIIPSMLYKLHKDKTLFKAAYNLNEAIHMNFLRVAHLLSLHDKPSVLYKKRKEEPTSGTCGLQPRIKTLCTMDFSDCQKNYLPSKVYISLC